MGKRLLHVLQDDRVTGEVRVVVTVDRQAVGDGDGDGEWVRACLRDMCLKHAPLGFWKSDLPAEEFLAEFLAKRKAA